MTAVALRTFSLLAALLMASWLLPADLKAQPAGKRPAKSTPAPPKPAPVPDQLLYKEEDPDPFARQAQAFGSQLASKYAVPRARLGKANFASSEQVDPFTAQKNYNPNGFNPSDVKGNKKRYKRR